MFYNMPQCYKNQYFVSVAIFMLIGTFFAFSTKKYPAIPQKYKIRTVVIDAGHGGRDPGTAGKSTKEKEINLAVSLELGAVIKKYLPEVNVVYTRTTDTFVELHSRASIASKNNCDVFISIHCNALEIKKIPKNTETKGLEVFVLGTHANKENLEVAKRENAVVLLEDNYKKNYSISPQRIITLNSIQNNYLENSLRLSSLIDKQFGERLSRKTKGVRQAGFLVLREVACTSILVELGYLSNEEEENYMKDSWNQTLMASAIYRAFRDFKNEVER